MSLKAFEFAPVEEGYRYELARGYIVVSEVPNFLHACVVVFIRNAPDRVSVGQSWPHFMVLGAMDCKLVIPNSIANAIPIWPCILAPPRVAQRPHHVADLDARNRHRSGFA